MNKLKDAAEKYALECEKRNWIYCVRDAFLAGASFERQRILELLRAEEGMPAGFASYWADYIEKELDSEV